MMLRIFVRRGLLAAALLLPALALPGVADADPAWTLSVIDDDDLWAPNNHDEHYTHGIRFTAVSGDETNGFWQAPLQWLPLFAADGAGIKRSELMIGQNMYTPADLATAPPNPRDRPYAGWLYGGFGLMQDNDEREFNHVALRFGVVGPSSYAAQAQTLVHSLIKDSHPNGWAYQLHDEPTLDLFAERKWRLYAALAPQSVIGVDALPQFSARAGNVYDYVGSGFMLRLGHNLLVDYGPPHIDGNLGSSEISPENGIGNWAWYAFVGSEGRLVGRNIFLDGNSFRSSPSVDKEFAVADLEAGFAVLYQHTRLAYTYVYRTREFRTQTQADHYGSLNLGLRLPF